MLLALTLMIQNSSFGAVTLTKNADIDKYQYSGYGIGFYKKSSLSFAGGRFGEPVIIFGVDMSSSALLIIRKLC